MTAALAFGIATDCRHDSPPPRGRVIGLRDNIYCMKKYAKFLAALISGIGATATIFAAPTFQRSTGTDLSRMRGDVERVGATMRAVIERERVERKTAR